MAYQPRMLLKTRTKRNGDRVLYCIFDVGKGLEFSFRPKWDEILDLATKMLETEHANKGRQLRYIVRQLKSIAREGEHLLEQE